jgi:hypothetical protein
MRAILKTINFVSICLIVREATELPYYFFFITKQSIQCFATEQKGEIKNLLMLEFFFLFCIHLLQNFISIFTQQIVSL